MCDRSKTIGPIVVMASVHDAGKLKFGAKGKGKKRKNTFLNNRTPWK
jgi:hypothetical protein